MDFTRKIKNTAYTFDDVLLVPYYSNILPSQVDVKTRITKNIELSIPFLSAAMDTVTELDMVIEMAQLGGLAIIHKNMSIEAQVNIVIEAKKVNDKFLVGAAIGIAEDTWERVEKLVAAKVDILSIDSAHGHSQGIIDLVQTLKSKYPKLELIVGNVVTAQATEDLIRVGADAIKVGVGPGSICTTRIVAGVGMPQLSAILECASMAHYYGIPVIADGGIRNSGDIAKALGAGASAVMLGSLLASTNASPGEVIEKNGIKHKYYRGMGSLVAMQQKHNSSDRYFQSHNKKITAEGIESLIEYKGLTKDIISNLLGGIKQSFGYLGAKNLKEFWNHTSFVIQTNNGLNESKPHDVIELKNCDVAGK